MKNNLTFYFPPGDEGNDLIQALLDQFTVKQENPQPVSLTFLDTFDWLLFNKSLALYRSDHELVLRRLSDGEILSSLEINATPIFASQLPDSSLKGQLQPVLEPRALLELAQVKLHSTVYRVLNQDEKTVARLVHTQAHTIQEDAAILVAVYIELGPVRGYPKYTRQLIELLESAGLSRAGWSQLYFSALEAAGKTPGDYSSKFFVQLKPDLRADQATKLILRSLLDTMQANEEGIRADIDSEFLHDFRVSVRRTRSALSQIRNVFPAEVTDRFKADFAYLGELTNPLRDLDVYLLSEGVYKSMLPAGIRADIDPLFDYLKTQRSTALAQVIAGLDSAKYAGIIRDWSKFLDEPVPPQPGEENAARPIITLAQQRIYKRYRRVIQDGNQILLTQPEDEQLHALRIDCKKLRYLIEFFSSLFPAKKVERLVGQLKRLQDNLGDFNDLAVQQDYLLNIAGDLPLNDERSRRTLVATGRLVETLARQQEQVKAAFAETFLGFASKKNQELYRELFSKKAATERAVS